jgi:hypothetical protein
MHCCTRFYNAGHVLLTIVKPDFPSHSFLDLVQQGFVALLQLNHQHAAHAWLAVLSAMDRT